MKLQYDGTQSLILFIAFKKAATREPRRKEERERIIDEKPKKANGSRASVASDHP